MIVMYFGWLLTVHPASPDAPISLPTEGETRPSLARRMLARLHDLVDTKTVNLTRDEYEEEPEDVADDQKREARLKGRRGWAWRVFYAVA